MFFIRLIQFLIGYVRIQVEGGSPERFLTFASRAGINLWNIRRRNGVLYMNVRARKFKKLRPAARKACVRLKIVKRRGIPFWFHRYRKRKGILAGAVIFLLIVWFFSGFVWTVDIAGNKNVSTQDISQVLADLGMKPGAFRLLLNVRQIEQQTLMRLPDLSWISINLQGSSAMIKVKERVYPHELVPLDQPCNVKASQTGQIIRIQAYEGMPLVKKGDTVKKGDVIVSGIIEEKTGAVRLAHASASVIAKTNRELSAEVKYRQTERKFTGKAKKRYDLYLLGAIIPLHFGAEPQEGYLKSTFESRLRIGTLLLPVGIRTAEYREFKNVDVKLTDKSAEQKARSRLTTAEAKEFSGVKIISRKYEVHKNTDGITVTGCYICEEDIAYEEEFKIS